MKNDREKSEQFWLCTHPTKLNKQELSQLQPFIDMFNGEIVGVYLKGVIE